MEHVIVKLDILEMLVKRLLVRIAVLVMELVETFNAIAKKISMD